MRCNDEYNAAGSVQCCSRSLQGSSVTCWAKFGFLITSDGWRSAAKLNYHNYILVSVEGPIFLGLEEVTGEGGTSEDIARQFEAKLNDLGAEITKRVLIGVTDTHSANQKA